ncbi:MAG: HAMP domain-containing histidine kinase [Deltaproteobacteria bacterium]|nr:HAMP domain-containing histidine kinase [Deltaproteobacteria bacterium]
MNWGRERDRNRPLADHVLLELGWLLLLILFLVVGVLTIVLYRSNVRRDHAEATTLAATVAASVHEDELAGRPPRERIKLLLGPALDEGLVRGWAWYRAGERNHLSGGGAPRDEVQDFAADGEICFRTGDCPTPPLRIGPWWSPIPFHAVAFAGHDEARRPARMIVMWGHPREPAFFGDLRSPWLLAYLVALVVLLTGLGWWRLRTLVENPLARMIGSMRRVEAGDFGVRVNERTCRELGELSAQFNVMTAALETKSAELGRRMQELEQANQAIRQARDETIQAEKLAGIGRLAAGIAHEVGNPLAALTGFAELLDDETLEPAARADIVRRMQDELARTDRIIRGLLDYARAGSRGDLRFEPGQVAAQAVELCRGRGLFDGITVDYSCSSSSRVAGEPGQIEQVFINLMLNAADAMGSGGRLDIRISDSQDGRWVEARVRDHGSGIRQEDLVKIFDPFFTTKEPGKGTGLGLAISARLVEAHGGSLQVERSSPEGTVFLMRLPVAER